MPSGDGFPNGWLSEADRFDPAATERPACNSFLRVIGAWRVSGRYCQLHPEGNYVPLNHAKERLP